MAGMRVSKNKIRRLALMEIEDLGEGAVITADKLAEELGMSDSAAAKLLTEMADGGDIDRQFPPNEPGKRGRAKAVFTKMTDERYDVLSETIAAREKVAVKLNAFTSANVTLRRVTLSLHDACVLLGITPPAVDVFANEPDDEDVVELGTDDASVAG